MNHSTTDRKFANTLARGLKVLGVFRASDDGLTHAQIAERTALPKPTISRLTYTLCELGFLTQASRNDRFHLGPAAIALGSVATISATFIDLISDAMQELANETGTLGLIAVRDTMRMMLVKTWRPEGTASIWLEPGHRIPLFGSSSGQATLAAMSDDKFAGLAPNPALVDFRQDGYAQLIAQGFTIAPRPTRYARTVNAVGVPFFASEFGAPVAISCGALPEVLTDARMVEEVGPALREVVRELEHRTGQAPALTRRG
ncbi:helix-turn-helix domain-containing protein [uncultured Roseobacter sp.]|uniref:IclR family transcriptional regulator n=1 Tax=uncultured Roseobacter sp. TaxID=114847 RepID=UPI00262C9045|nr:helix-turn-helix domain-containing protein [uncultured Roseobacter sp.]